VSEISFAEFSISDSLKSRLAQARLWYHGVNLARSWITMYKSDRTSRILLLINAGVPLALLIAVVALIVRHVTLA
jgi:hypothetical protein